MCVCLLVGLGVRAVERGRGHGLPGQGASSPRDDH